jgi:hypothetical protein
MGVATVVSSRGGSSGIGNDAKSVVQRPLVDRLIYGRRGGNAAERTGAGVDIKVGVGEPFDFDIFEVDLSLP